MSLIFVLLAILKYIGLLILFLLAVFLAAVCVVLFCPVSYAAESRGSQARFTAKWLFNAVAVRLEYLEKNLKFDLFVFGRANKTPKNGAQSAKANKTQKNGAQSAEPIKSAGNGAQGFNQKKAFKRKKLIKKERSKDGGGLKKTLKLALSFVNHPERGVIVKKTLLLLKRLLRPLKPSKFNLNGEIGFDSPDITGKFIALQSVLVCFTGLPVNIKGNFERKYVNLNLSASGRLNLFSLLWPAVLYVLSKPMRKIIWKLITNKEEKNE